MAANTTNAGVDMIQMPLLRIPIPMKSTCRSPIHCSCVSIITSPPIVAHGNPP